MNEAVALLTNGYGVGREIVRSLDAAGCVAVGARRAKSTTEARSRRARRPACTTA